MGEAALLHSVAIGVYPQLDGNAAGLDHPVLDLRDDGGGDRETESMADVFVEERLDRLDPGRRGLVVPLETWWATSLVLSASESSLLRW